MITIRNTKKTWVKVWFSSELGSTAKLVIPTESLKTSLSELSRMFPYSEAAKMKRFHCSTEFGTWIEAFNAQDEE